MTALTYNTRAEFGGLWIEGVEPLPLKRTAFVGGLVMVHRARPSIITGAKMGPVSVSIERRDTIPPTPDSRWEDVIEIDLTPRLIPGVFDYVFVHGPSDAPPRAELALNPKGAEPFRLRIHALNRDADYDVVASEPREIYLLQTWPSTSTIPPKVLRATSKASQQYGAETTGEV